MITYKALKGFLETLTEEQLNQPVVVFRDDEETGEVVDSWDSTPEDVYWDDGECVGNLPEAYIYCTNNGVNIRELTVVKAGQISLYITTESTS